MQQIDTSIL